MMQGSSQPISKTIGLVVFPLRNPDEECWQSSISQREQKSRELLTSMQLRKELGANARIFVEQKFSSDKTIQDWIEGFEEAG
jgi:hypothetical protein